MYTRDMNNNDTAPTFTLYRKDEGGFPVVISEHATADAAVAAGNRVATLSGPVPDLWVLDPDTEVIWDF